MNSAARAFDFLEWFDRFKSASVPENNAIVFAEALRNQSEAHKSTMREALSEYDGVSRKDLATKDDIQDVRNDVQDVRGTLYEDIQNVRVTLHEEIQDVHKCPGFKLDLTAAPF